MKTILVAAAMALTTLSASANNSASQKKVSVTIARSFENEFGVVEDVVWAPAAKNLTRATFTKNNEKQSAFFNQAGEFVATTIDRRPEEIPFKLKNAIAAKEKDGVITEAVEFQDNDEISYFVKVYVNGVEKLYKGNSLGVAEQVKW